ncbi:peptidoglycan-recognition protein LE [Drosophila tropicalis]|uniref:peptidoglycan-recognition protein LE n=1 Tax=Drosophila tropicalis TaxID=46794 RepID=UPI0035AC203F
MSRMPIRELSQERTIEWLAAQAQTQNDEVDEDELESIAESSVVDSLDYEYSERNDDDEDDDDEETSEEISTVALGTTLPISKRSVIGDLRDIMNSINSIQTVGNVNISNSTNVHIGNVTNINGNIQIIADTGIRSRREHRRKVTTPPPAFEAENDLQQNANGTTEEAEERIRSDVFISRQKFKIPKELCSIIPRYSWLAQRPIEEPSVLERPVKYVVILHTATESSEKRAINVRLIRDIQCFHIESREWNDIAYNFLIGCDGNIYEGRGWRAVGAHTLGYNRIALGISFIGCFMRELPTTDALNMCRNLLARGVEEGHISPDYRLVCHCQCNSTESPGRRLYEEIQTWPHFYNIEREGQTE